MKTIRLADGRDVKLNYSDWKKLSKYHWYATTQGYASRQVTFRGKRRLILMHRLIMDNPRGIIDHINQDKLDNRRKNLRVANKSVNRLNSKLNTNNTSGFRGISWSVKYQKWQVRCGQVWIGSFDSISRAKNAYSDYLK